MAAGALTLGQIRNGPAATCTLLPTSLSGAVNDGKDVEVGEPVPAPVVPLESPAEAEELLADLVGVLFRLRGDAWAAVCAAVPRPLQERIDRYFGWS